jgi:hypothetical protein
LKKALLDLKFEMHEPSYFSGNAGGTLKTDPSELAPE